MMGLSGYWEKEVRPEVSAEEIKAHEERRSLQRRSKTLPKCW